MGKRKRIKWRTTRSTSREFGGDEFDVFEDAHWEEDILGRYEVERWEHAPKRPKKRWRRRLEERAAGEDSYLEWGA